MGKIIFSISYEINPDKRDDYLALMKKIKKEVKSKTKQDYSVYEDLERPNLMTEVFFLKEEKDVDLVKKLMVEKGDPLFDEIDSFILNQEEVAIRIFRENI